MGVCVCVRVPVRVYVPGLLEEGMGRPQCAPLSSTRRFLYWAPKGIIGKKEVSLQRQLENGSCRFSGEVEIFKQGAT